MTGYPTMHAYASALAGLIDSGATLEDLYRALGTVADAPAVDASPRELRRLATSWTQSPSLVPIRLHELYAGLVVEHTDDYVLALVAGLGGRHSTEIRAFMLRHDDALREEVFWRVFEVEGGGEISLANIDKYSRTEGNWHETVLALAADGTLDRARLLRSCLEALNRDFAAYRAGWFSRVYAALAPTPAEAAVDQGLLRLTLASTVTASVSLATTTLADVHAAGLLDAAAYVEACVPVLTGAKGVATRTLRVLAALAEPDDEGAGPGVDRSEVTRTLALGLGNRHADVQRAAVAALLRLGREDLAREGRELLAPAVAAQLLPEGDAAPGPTPGSAPAPAPGPAPGVASAGASAGVAVDQARPEAVPVTAWTDDDALERFAVLLADPADVIEVELALAWLASTPAAGAILAPLGRRVRRPRLVGSDYEPLPELLLAALDADHDVMATEHHRPWVAGQDERARARATPRQLPTAEERSSVPVFVARLREVAAILQRQAPGRVLLATPTDSHGWVDPTVLLERVHATQSRGLALAPADLTQALLRLAPGTREGVLAHLGLPAPVVTEAIQVVWHRSESGSRKANGTPEWVWWRPLVHADTATAASIEHPGRIPSALDPTFHDSSRTALETGQIALVDPTSTLPLVASGVALLAAAADEATPVGEEAVLDALVWHPGAWTAETVQLVALGMAARRPEIRSRSVELLTVSVPGRVGTDDAAAGFAACAPACVLTRWAGSFADAASLDAALVVDLLTALLPRLDRAQRGTGSLLTVLLDESLRLRRSTTDPALRAWLQTVTGSSAAARAARALLAGPGGARAVPPSGTQQSATQQSATQQGVTQQSGTPS